MGALLISMFFASGMESERWISCDRTVLPSISRKTRNFKHRLPVVLVNLENLYDSLNRLPTSTERKTERERERERERKIRESVNQSISLDRRTAYFVRTVKRALRLIRNKLKAESFPRRFHEYL